jgi:hypothetical protein
MTGGADFDVGHDEVKPVSKVSSDPFNKSVRAMLADVKSPSLT